jgi:APA family basic amino acid/polyamine antiporter
MSEKRTKLKKFTTIVVIAAVVNAIVGSGIVRHSLKWVGEGGSYALAGLLLVWIVFIIVGLAMSDNVSMMPEKGGVYIWSRKTMGRFAGNQVGWIYLVGFTCLSVILSWLAYENTLIAVQYFLPGQSAVLGATIFSIIIPMFFIVVFTFIFTLGIKNTTQVLIAFFTIKVTMWLTIVGIGLLHFEPTAAVNTPETTLDPLYATLSTGLLTLFAMQGIDAVSVISGDIHKPGKNYAKGVVVGMIIVLLLYLSTVIVIFGLVGQGGAQSILSTGGNIADVFEGALSVPTPVLLVFLVISIIGTLFINMYFLIRVSGAMAENNDFFFGKHARKQLEKTQSLKPSDKPEVPITSIIASTLIYAVFFVLIFLENLIDSDTGFVVYVIDKLALWPFLIILFFIALTNFKAHRMGLGKKRREEKGEFKLTRGYVLPILGMVSMGFIIFLSAYGDWSKLLTGQVIDGLPGPADSYAWQFWQFLGVIFPAFMIVPGLLFWLIKGRKHSLPVDKIELPSGETPIKEEKKKKEKKKKEKKKKKDSETEPEPEPVIISEPTEETSQEEKEG